MKPVGGQTLRIAGWLFAFTISLGACSDKGREISLENARLQNPSEATRNEAIAWNKSAASSYLEQRETWWEQWKGAKRDQGTFCISCHTNLTFVFAHSVREGVSADRNTPDNYGILIQNVRTRVRSWKDVEPYYGELTDYASKGPASSTLLFLPMMILPAGSLPKTGA
jgi:hypothetical protein